MSRGRTAATRRVARIVGVGLTVATAAWGGMALTSTMAHERTTTRQELATTVTRFELPELPGRLLLQGTSSARRAFVQELHSGVSSPDVRSDVSGSTLTYRASCWWFDERCGVNLSAEIDRSAPVRASSSGGDVEARDLTGPLTLRSSAGDVTVRGATGDLDLESSAGDVRVVGSGSRRLRASSSAGDVRVELTEDPEDVAVSSSAGDVTILLPPNSAVSYRVEASSSGGDTDVEVRTDPAGTRVIRASSSAGDVRIRYGDS